MKTKIEEYVVGDKIWQTDINFGLSQVVITKIGNKLIHCAKNSFDKVSLRQHGDYSHKVLIPDYDAYINKRRACKLKDKIVNVITDSNFYIDHPKFSLETLTTIAELLGIES